MKPYDYLFFKSYQLAVKSGNFKDAPVLGAIGFIALCWMFNLFTIVLLLQGVGVTMVQFGKDYKLAFSLGLVLLAGAYYQSRHRHIIEKYEQRELVNRPKMHPLVVIALYYGGSFGLLLLAGMFKNGDWIFSQYAAR